MAKTIKVEFLQDRVMFLNGLRTFCCSNQVRDEDGKYRPRKKYSLPSELHDEFVEKGIIKSARKSKK